MPGPAPKPEGQRRGRNQLLVPGMTYLPSSGRSGPPPEWPLPTLQDGELDIWADLWRKPQAVAWERIDAVRTVARYVRVLTEAEAKGASAAILAQATAFEDRLGLTPMAAARLRWQITEDELSEKRAPAPQAAKPKRRLKAVDPGAVAGA